MSQPTRCRVLYLSLWLVFALAIFGTMDRGGSRAEQANVKLEQPPASTTTTVADLQHQQARSADRQRAK